MPKESGRKAVATNRKARHDYHILDTWEAGLVLMGTEVKSLRDGHISLTDGFCSFSHGELWLEAVPGSQLCPLSRTMPEQWQCLRPAY